jgi:beta-1,4-mannosyltransferase
VRIVTEAEMVVLPYRHMHNSGTVLYALSLGRPVLVPDNEINRALSDEVGPGWVHRFSDTLTGSSLAAAIVALRSAPPVGRPDLSAREWPAGGVGHLEAYRLAWGAKACLRGTSSPRTTRPSRLRSPL